MVGSAVGDWDAVNSGVGNFAGPFVGGVVGAVVGIRKMVCFFLVSGFVGTLLGSWWALMLGYG